MMEPQQEKHAGLIGNVAAMVKDFAGLVRNRIELAALELSELRANLLTFVVVVLMAVVMLWFAIAYWSALIVYLSWDALGWKIVPIVAAVFTLAGLLLLRHARAMIKDGKLSMPATMSELRNDRDALL